MMSLVSVKKNTVLSDNRIIVKSGNHKYSNADVQIAAKLFDKKLNESLKDNSLKYKLERLAKDWNGDDDSEEGSFNFDPGYYRELKVVTWASNEEMSHIRDFDTILSSILNNSTLTRSGVSVEEIGKIASNLTISPEELDANVDLLWLDIKKDACSESYGPECEGSDSEVDEVSECILDMEKNGEVVDASSVLGCANVEATKENIKKFAECFNSKKTSTGSVPRGTLGYCALYVKRTKAETAKAHSTQAWRDRYETWMRAYLNSEKSDLTNYIKQYNAYRDEFVSKGGATSAKSVEEPSITGIIPKWVYYTVGGLFVLIIVSQVSSIVQAVSVIRK
jgi:hypothetical protein